MKTRVTRHWHGQLVAYYYLVERYGPLTPGEMQRIGPGAESMECFHRDEWQCVAQLADRGEAQTLARRLSALRFEDLDAAEFNVVAAFEDGKAVGNPTQD